jgi:hypothetical protein
MAADTRISDPPLCDRCGKNKPLPGWTPAMHASDRACKCPPPIRDTEGATPPTLQVVPCKWCGGLAARVYPTNPPWGGQWWACQNSNCTERGAPFSANAPPVAPPSEQTTTAPTEDAIEIHAWAALIAVRRRSLGWDADQRINFEPNALRGTLLDIREFAPAAFHAALNVAESRLEGYEWAVRAWVEAEDALNKLMNEPNVPLADMAVASRKCTAASAALRSLVSPTTTTKD